MTLAAHQVLLDCFLAHEIMEAEKSASRIRIQWIGALALCRLVGDVLDKVDAQTRPRYAAPIKKHWETLKQDKPPIFWEFIKGSRDRAVHLYELDLPSSPDATFMFDSVDGLSQAQLNDCLLMPLLDGYGAGDDARDVYLEALHWWLTQLQSIETEAA